VPAARAPAPRASRGGRPQAGREFLPMRPLRHRRCSRLRPAPPELPMIAALRPPRSGSLERSSWLLARGLGMPARRLSGNAHFRRQSRCQQVPPRPAPTRGPARAATTSAWSNAVLPTAVAPGARTLTGTPASISRLAPSKLGRPPPDGRARATRTGRSGFRGWASERPTRPRRCGGRLAAMPQRYELHGFGADACSGAGPRPEVRAVAPTTRSRRLRCGCPAFPRCAARARSWRWPAIHRCPPRGLR
jgi:hypothetical protein